MNTNLHGVYHFVFLKSQELAYELYVVQVCEI